MVNTELFDYIRDNNVPTPVALKIRVDGSRPAANGLTRYYLYVVAGNKNVSDMVGPVLGYKNSGSGPYYGDVMVPGADETVGTGLQRQLYEIAEEHGYHGMIDPERCVVVKKSRKTDRRHGQGPMAHVMQGAGYERDR